MEENNFSNNVIQSSLLPKAEEVAFELLHPNLPKVHLVFNSCVILILVVLNILNYQFNWANPILSYVALGVTCIVSLLLLIYPYNAYRYKGLAIREKDIIFKEGIFFQNISITPYNRIQHCEIDQGPIDRIFSLCTLQLFTAAGSSSEINVDGLSPDKAATIKQFIMSKSTLDEEE